MRYKNNPLDAVNRIIKETLVRVNNVHTNASLKSASTDIVDADLYFDRVLSEHGGVFTEENEKEVIQSLEELLNDVLDKSEDEDESDN
jgi:hypothetical protein